MVARHNAEPMTPSNASKPRPEVGPVVSSAHLAQSELPALSEVEFALTMANHAFQRWMVRCMEAAGGPALSPLEVLIVHLVHHRARPKTLADICLVLNIEDTHLANYAIRKLVGHGLVKQGRKGKEKTVSITEAGAALCTRYGEIREALVVRAARQMGHDPLDISRMAAMLRTLSGAYDQAARAAAAL
ncbi:winged helix DNA-binding protein [Rhodobacteraceae bacterium 2376]|uniref:Winged helix DNA-binding protein n=2 Tax=Rhabdonatronobacter sediminivivens TaxID=2743469 RepID=A0A7Z0HWN2_9RHOB|nr:winged helix DNA-binding protein [Rhabdonatronobacter sediminivivens]